MKCKFRIKQTENLENKYFPVIAFFNAITDSSFIRTIEYIVNGIGSSFNDVHCEFPEDIDADEEAFEGIRFAVFNEEIVLNYQEVYYFIKLACQSYVKDNDKDKDIILKLLKDFRTKYRVNEN